MPQSVCEIITIGNELLIGKTLNTNAHWLAKHITNLGGEVARITVIGDDVDEIASSVKEAIERENDFIITVGGLGPTFDDKTLEGVAKALGVKLEVHDQALKMVKEKYRRYVEEGRMETVELTPYRVKMARLPEGGSPMFNPLGTAPGVIIEHKGMDLVALPGVPLEMNAIFNESVAPLIKRAAGHVAFLETSLKLEGIAESEAAPIIDRVMHDNPHVYIKSHPKGSEPTPLIELHLTTASKSEETAKNRIGTAAKQISQLITRHGGKVEVMAAQNPDPPSPRQGLA